MDTAMRINTQDAAFHGAGNPKRPFQIVGPQRAVRSVRRCIDFTKHLSFVLEGRGANHRSKYFFSPATISFVDSQQDRGLEEDPRARQASAATSKLAPPRPGIR